MTTPRFALIAATTSLVAWTAKSVAIGIAGGLDRSPLEGPLFLLGFLAQVAAVVALALATTTGRPVPLRVGAVVAAVLAAFATVSVIGLVVERIQPADPSWAWAEVNLWVIAPLVLAAAVAVARPRRYAVARPSGKVSTVS